MADVHPHQYLYNNLILLHELKPGSSDLVKCIKENMFAKPNRTAFDQVLFYLCSTYDPEHYIPKVPWPILDRSQERTFRQNTVSFIKDILKEKPEARIPAFSPSFLSTPGGERLTKFMWKFSLLVLKTVVERESDFDVLDYPTAGLNLVQNLTESCAQELALELDDLCQLIIDASTYSKKLSNDIHNQYQEIQSLKAEQAELLQRSENCPLSHEEKQVLLGGDREQSNAVLMKWQAFLDGEVDETKNSLQHLKTHITAIKNCYESVKTLVNSKSKPLVLDASLIPSNLKDADGNLDLAYVLSEGANAVRTLLNSISMYGGFQSYDSVLQPLENFREQLQKIEISFTETKAGFIELISASLENMSSPIDKNDQSVTPLKGGLQLGYEMLQDAQTSTPPLVFDSHSEVSLKSRISAESPPIDGLVGAMKPLSRGKSSQDSGPASTPKASQGLSSKSFVGKIPFPSSIPKRNLKSVNDCQKALMKSSVMQTPANFHSKQFTTSTACKPTSSMDPNHQEGHPECYPKKCPSVQGSVRTLNRIKEVSQSIANSPLPSPVAVSKRGNDITTACMVVIDPTHVISPVFNPSEPPSISGCKNSPTLPTGKDAMPSIASPQLLRTSAGNHLFPQGNINKCLKSPVPAVVTQNESSHDLFDSPQSTCGILSPLSAENSFFSTDLPGSFMAVPKFDLDLEDEISPSGRVSLCPSTDDKEIKVPEASPAPIDQKAPENSSNRRKSLLPIIHRYRELLASSKPYKAAMVSPPSSPDLDAPSDVKLDESNIE